MQPKRLLPVTLCLLSVLGGWAQRNVYVNEEVNGYNRVRIVNGVDRIDFGRDSLTMWSGEAAATFATPAVGMMSFHEKDPWRGKVMPERYLADFDYDIVFEEADKELVRPEPLATDTASVQYDDFVEHSTWTKTVYVNYDDADVSVEGDTDSLTVTRESGHLTIHTAAAGVRYVISGASSDASFKLYSERKACLVLNDADLTNPYGPVINSQLKKRLFIVIAAGTVNTLTDGDAYIKVKGEDQRGCIFAEGKLCISGEGQLYVTGRKKCGIASDEYVHIIGGFIHVAAHAPKGKAVYGQENVMIGGGVVRTFSDGAAGKGIASDSLLWITGGVIKAVTTGDAVWEEAEEDYSSCCAVKSAWDMTITGGAIHCLSTGVGGKGISAGTLLDENGKKYYNGTLTIGGADIRVRTTGTRIPLEKQEDGHGHKIGASASPKCIKSIGKLTVNSGTVCVRGSGGMAAEGLETKRQAEINGGIIRSYCVDDGLNSSGCVINGGDVLLCSSENDGFDGSSLRVNGGMLYTVGGADAQMGIDTDGKTFEVRGGEVVGVGSLSCNPHGTSTQAAVVAYLKKSYVSGVALAEADGTIISAIPTPSDYRRIGVFFSSAAIREGGSYRILSYKESFADTPTVEYEFTMDGLFVMLGSK